MDILQLENGLRIVSEQMPATRSVSFGIWVKNGSRDERPHHNGISHLIEHMLFKGTSTRTAKQIAEIFDHIGGNVNAFTSKEYTCYYAKVLDEHLPIAVEVLADMFFNSIFDSEELEKEKQVIFEEISMYEDTPDDYVHDLIAEAAYGRHPLAFPILGTEDVLGSLTPEHIRDFMDRRYTSANTVISVAGHVDDSVYDLIRTHFQRFPHSTVDTNQIEQPAYKGMKLHHAKHTEQNHICLALPGLPLGDPRLHSFTLLNNVIGGGMSSRLFQEVREKHGLAYSIYSYHSAHMDSGLFTIYAGTHPRHSGDVLEVILQTLKDIHVNGITEDELERGKEQLKGNLILGLESTSSRMNRNGKYELMLRRHETLDELINKLDAITLSDLQDLIDELFSHSFSAALVGESDEALTQLDSSFLKGDSHGN